MKVIEEKITELSKNPIIRKNGIQIKALGNLDMLPEELKKAIHKSEMSTKDNTNHILNIALDTVEGKKLSMR